jgi:hypothetical protein
MSRMLCAALLLFATASASLAQNGSLPAGPIPPAVVKALAPTGKLRAAINARDQGIQRSSWDLIIWPAEVRKIWLVAEAQTHQLQ